MSFLFRLVCGTILVMLFVDFLQWWYGAGWALRVQMLMRHVQNWLTYFSVGILLSTMFSPWRQNVTTARPDEALQAKMNAGVDNVISRLVGFMVRVFALVAAALTVLFVMLFNAVVVLLWPLIPLLPAILLGVGLSV